MDGQMFQICRIAAAAKKALKDKSTALYTPLKYENKIEFQCLPENKLLGAETYKAENVAAWYNYCLKKGLRDIKFLAPIAVKNRSILGFSNTNQSSIVCFYEEEVTYFTPQWEFDSAQKMWNILYTEQEWKDAPSGKPRFENNTESFKDILAKIKDLACKIDCDYFSSLFQAALDTLSGSSDYTGEGNNIPLPEIPAENLYLFKAASTADVFGAMGSWNDSPPSMAHEKGLDKEYEAFSDELLKQVRLAILYSINEW